LRFCAFLGGLISPFWAFFVMSVTVITKEAQNDEISPQNTQDPRGKLVLIISVKDVEI